MENSLLHKVVAISIGLFVAAIMLPMALLQLANTTWTATNGDVNPAVVTVITVLLPVLAVIGIAIYFLRSE
jgi:hypothetical protein